MNKNGCTNIWTRIDTREINRALSSEYLEILEPLLERSSEEIPLKDDRSEKAEIYKMTMLPKLHLTNFRKKIFSYFTDKELKGISREIGLQKTSRKEMIENIGKIPWNNNSKAIKIAEFIGVPKFMLEISLEKGESIPEIVYPWIIKYDLFLKTLKKELLKKEFSNRCPFKTLKDYQAIAHQDILEKINLNYGRCILNMPTGTGKTRTAMEAVCSYLLNNPTHSVIWIAHTKELLDQAALEFSQLWEFLGDKKIRIIRCYANQDKKIPKDPPSFIATSFQTLLKNSSSFLTIPVGLIIVDEAHVTMAKKWKQAVLKLKRPEFATKILGLTATPLRADLSDTKKLISFYNDELIQLKYKSDKPIFEFLIEEGILAKPKYEKISSSEIFTLTEKQIKKIQNQNIDFPIDFLESLAKNGARNLEITKKLKEILGDPKDTKQILFFGLSVEHSKMIATWLIKNNYPAFHLDAKVNPISRKTCIDAFKLGKLRVLCNYGVLSTGFDAPKVDCIFIARPTTSHILHSQMIGRGLRGPKLGGTESCLIVEVEDNIKNFSEDQKISFEKYRKLWEIKPEELLSKNE